jgi:hypothetical protein
MEIENMGKEKIFSIRKGYTFSFEDEGNVIDAWFSTLSGLEKVYVNGELVSSQRNISTNSTNHFKIGVNEYSINLKAVSLLSGPLVCTLSKNGREYKRQKLVFPKLESSAKVLFFILILGVISLEFASSHWQLPKYYILVFFVFVFIASFLYDWKNRKKRNLTEDVKIENEEII